MVAFKTCHGIQDTFSLLFQYKFLNVQQKPHSAWRLPLNNKTTLFFSYCTLYKYSHYTNLCLRNVDFCPSLVEAFCAAFCSCVWWMIRPCSLWSLTGSQRTSPTATTQMWQASRQWPRWEQDRWKASRVSSVKQNQTYCLRIHFRLPPFLSYRLSSSG